MPKRTHQPKKLREIRRRGFRAKMKTKKGRNTLKNRRKKGRDNLTPSAKHTTDKNKKFPRRR